MPEAGLTAAGMVVAEVITGLWLGWLARLFCLALPIAGAVHRLLARHLHRAAARRRSWARKAPRWRPCSSIAAPLVILVSGLYVLPLTALAGSYRLIPPGTLLPAADSTATAVPRSGRRSRSALRLASPFVLAAIVWHVAIGLIARLVPRLQIYFVSLPGQIVGGLAAAGQPVRRHPGGLAGRRA